MRISHWVGVIVVALVVAACGLPVESPAGETVTPTLAAVVPAPAVEPSVFTMLLPWPVRDAAGNLIAHPWTGGPHAAGTDANGKSSLCQPPADACAKDVAIKDRSGIDFGTGGGPDWDVYAVGPGTLVYKGPFGTTGFGAGAITQHGDLFVLYGHMDEASLAAAPAIGQPVSHDTKLGTTSCSGMNGGCVRHLHLELRTGLTVTGGKVSLGAHEPWNGRTIGGWTISVGEGELNYNGMAKASGCLPDTITANVVGPSIFDASTCGDTAALPTPTPAPLPTLTPTPTPVPSARPVPPPAPTGVIVAARGAGREIYCDDFGCSYEPSGGPSKWRLTWKDVGAETGYRVYVSYEGFVWDSVACARFVHTPRHLIATLPKNTTRLDGVWTAEGDGTKAHPIILASTYYVRAFNSAGQSKPAASRTIMYSAGGPNCAGPG